MLDSLFPTGAFAHSFDLEAAVQERLVLASDAADSLQRFLNGMLHQTANLALPIVFTAVSLHPLDVDALLALNDQVNALLITNSVAPKAFIAQGNALVRVALTLRKDQQEATRVLLDNRGALRQRHVVKWS